MTSFGKEKFKYQCNIEQLHGIFIDMMEKKNGAVVCHGNKFSKMAWQTNVRTLCKFMLIIL